MIIDRYLGAQLFIGTVLVLAALLVISSAIELMDEVHDMNDTYALTDVMRYIGLTMAGRVYEFLPVAVLIGGLINLGNLAAQSELVAFRAAGYPRKRIIFSVLGMGCLFAVFVAVFGETIMPLAEAAVARDRDDGGDSFQNTAAGIWSREGNHFIHAEEAAENGDYRNVSIYELGENDRLLRIVEGTSMRVESNRLLVRDARDTRITEQRIMLSRHPQIVIGRGIGFEEGVPMIGVPNAMNTLTLFKYIAFLESSSLRTDLHQYALWSRLSQPLAVVVMLLLALPFVFAPLRSSTGQRLFIGILIGLAYTLVAKLFGNAAIAFSFSPAVGALAPPLFGFAAGMYRLSLYR